VGDAESSQLDGEDGIRRVRTIEAAATPMSGDLRNDLVGAVPLEVYEAKAKATGLLRLPFEIGARGSSLALIRWADARPTPAAADLIELFVASARAFARVRKSRR
jgi:hypothetical protein